MTPKPSEVYDPGEHYTIGVHGSKIHYHDPRPFDLRDVLAALPHLCRWSGQVSSFWSVGQHTIAIEAMLVGYPAPVRRAALLHDAHEAYLGDWPRTLKRHLRCFTDEFARLESNFQSYMGQQFDFAIDDPDVKWWDDQIIHIEADLFREGGKHPNAQAEKQMSDDQEKALRMAVATILPWSPQRVRFELKRRLSAAGVYG